jgi:putative ABC transport system permease protein
MNLAAVFRIAWQGIGSNKLRSLLTMLGVIIGVAAVIVMVSVSAGTEAAIAEQIQSLGTNLLFITPNFSRGGAEARGPGGGGSDFLTFDDVNAIASDIQGVAGVSTQRETTQLVKAGSVSLDGVPLIGTTAGYPTVRDVQIGEGRFFNAQEVDRTTKVAVLGYSLAQELFPNGDAVGQSINVGTTKLKIIGVAAEKGVVGGTDFDSQMYLPITVVFQKFTPSQFARVIGDRVTTIFIKVADKNDIANVTFQTQILLAKRHDTTVDQLPYSISTQQDIIQTQEATSSAFRSLLAWVASVSLLVGGIGIMNIMLVSVTERTREIGIRQAVGATPGDVRLQFLAEALVLSLVGGIIGVIAGTGGSFLFGALGNLRTVVLPSSILLAFFSSAAVGVFFGYYPANKAAQLDPIVALRYE